MSELFNSINPYILLAFTTLLAASNNVTIHKFGNRGLNNPGDTLLFNSMVSVVWVLEVFALGGGFGALRGISGVSVVYGLIYGVVTAAFLLSKMGALAFGPAAIATLAGTCALIIPTLFGAVWQKETVTAAQWLGIAMLLAAVVLTVRVKKGDAAGMSLKFRIFCVCFFVTGGCTAIVFRLHQGTPHASEYNGMMLIASAVMAVVLGAAALAVNAAARNPAPRLSRVAWFYVPICGLISCTYTNFNIPLSSRIPNTIFFPVLNGGVLILVTLAGRLFFKEKLAWRQYLGVVLATISILFIGKVIG